MAETKFQAALDRATVKAIATTQERIEIALADLAASDASVEDAYTRGRKEAFLEIAHRSLEFPDFDRERRVIEAEARAQSAEADKARLVEALAHYDKAYEWVGADSFDGIDPRGRELLEIAHSEARLARAAIHPEGEAS